MNRPTRQDMELIVSPKQETLDEVKATLRKHFEIKDWQGVEIVMAAAAAHYVPGEMLWLRFIGPSRSGRTELLRAIAAHPDSAEIEVLTPAAFRGGLKKGPKLLERLNCRQVIAKDIATLLTARKEMRTEVFGVLSGIKDGRITSDFGSDEGHLEQTASFDWILAATTSGIEQQRQLDGLLGQRFIDLRWRPGNREEMAYKASSNNPYLEQIRGEMVVNVASLLCRAEQEFQFNTYPISDDDRRWIAKVADAAAILRGTVPHDRKGHIVSMPEPEVGAELARGLTRIAGGLSCLVATDWHPHIRRLARDCVPSLRLNLVEALENHPQSVPELEISTGLSERTVYYHLEELRLLGMAKDNAGTWELTMWLP